MLIKQPTDEDRLSCLSTFGKNVLTISEIVRMKRYGKKGRPPGHHDKADAERRADGDAPGNGYLSCIHPGALPARRYQPHNIL